MNPERQHGALSVHVDISQRQAAHAMSSYYMPVASKQACGVGEYTVHNNNHNITSWKHPAIWAGMDASDTRQLLLQGAGAVGSGQGDCGARR